MKGQIQKNMGPKLPNFGQIASIYFYTDLFKKPTFNAKQLFNHPLSCYECNVMQDIGKTNSLSNPLSSLTSLFWNKE